METAPIDVTVHLLFAFDVGYEIDLNRGRSVLSGEKVTLARRKRTPESIRYRPAPLRVSVDAAGFALPGFQSQESRPLAEIALFDFGAISLHVQHRVRVDRAGLSGLAGALADAAPLTAAARLTLGPWIERVKPLVEGFELSELSEEYVVFQLDAIEPDWLGSNADWVAGLVRLETEPLCETEVKEATRLSLSYAPNDVVVVDWAAALVADRECEDTVQVLEYANVQLLEFRHIDDRLDDRL